MLNDEQETQLSMTNRATHLCKCSGVDDLSTRPAPYVLPCRIWSFCIKGKGEPQRLGSAGTPLSWEERRV